MLRNITLLSFATFITLSACRSGDESNMPQIEKMKDTILKSYNNTMQVTVGVEDGTDLNIIVWDTKLYNGTDNDRQQRANEIGNTALFIFGKDNALAKEHFSVVKGDEKANPDATVSKGCNINIDSLKKISGK